MLYSVLAVKAAGFQLEREIPSTTRNFKSSGYAPVAGEHLVQYPITQLCSRGCDTDWEACLYGFGNGNIVDRKYGIARFDTTESGLKPRAYRKNRRLFLAPLGMKVRPSGNGARRCGCIVSEVDMIIV